MKKMIFAAALLAGAAFGVNAQENVNLPEAGDFAVEVQFNPFADDFNTFELGDGIKLQGRYFFGAQDAVRIGLGFGVNSEKNTPNPEAEDATKDAWTKNRVSQFAIDLGYERHFMQSGRVDLYAGLGLGFQLYNTCKTDNLIDVVDYASNGTPIYEQHEQKLYNAGSWNQFNVKAFTGVDFYVYRGLFVGAELGLKVGFKTFPGQYTKGGIVTNEQTGEQHWSDSYESPKGAKTTSFDLATYVEPSLRLGWTF